LLVWSGIVRALIWEYTLDMREGIHPEYNEIKATCSCGNVMLIKSTLKQDLSLDVCSSCHPFYTGKQKLVDTSGRVEKFEKRFGKKDKKTNRIEKVNETGAKETEELVPKQKVKSEVAEAAAPKKSVSKKSVPKKATEKKETSISSNKTNKPQK